MSFPPLSRYISTINKSLLLFAALFLCSRLSKAQVIHTIIGTVQDTTGSTLPGTLVKIKFASDSLATSTNADGAFVFKNVNASQITLSAAFIGFQKFARGYQLGNEALVTLPPVQLRTSSNTLNEVVITAVNPVKISEDTVAYNAASFPVRQGDAVEEVLKKLPGIEVDKDGNVTSQGEPVTKIRVNGKDFFGTDVATAIKNLPADIIKNLQFIDDYGDQAKLTGVKTGDPVKVLNINIEEDKRKGYFVRANAGIGNMDRYNTSLRANSFNGEQQLSFDGTINNANQWGNSGDGITYTKSASINYRNEWNKKISADGGYSFRNRDNTTAGTTLTQNFIQDFTRIENASSNNNTKNTDHNFWGNFEYKIDTMNYLKISPTLSYNLADSRNSGISNISQPNIVTLNDNNSLNNSSSFNGGTNLFYNHKFQKKGRNFSIFSNINYSKGDNDQGVINNYRITDSLGNDSLRYQNQAIVNDNNSFRAGVNLSYMEPLGKTTFLEFNYRWSRSNNKTIRDTRDIIGGSPVFNPDLSNNYEYQFTTNQVGVNFRVQEVKYNYTLGLNVQPALLQGQNLSKNISTENRTFNWVPSARFVYRFSKQQAFQVNYNGRSNQPAFTQLQPITDNSNLQNTITGNPNLKPEFVHSLNVRYNQSDWKMGHTLFANFAYSQTENKIVTTKVLIPNTINQVTSYTNTNGFYTIRGDYNYSKPFSERKYTVTLRGGATVNNNVSFVDDDRNVAKNYVLRQGVLFRLDLKDIVNMGLRTDYSINKTKYSQSSFSDRQTNRLELGIEGRNYFFKDLTLGYDFSKTVNKGYSNSSVSNPAILTLYTEYRFLKGKKGAIRLQGFDLFNQNSGISRDVFDNVIVDRQINRLGRYFMLSFNLRFDKFGNS